MGVMVVRAVGEGKYVGGNVVMVVVNVLVSILVVIWAVKLTKSDPSFKKELDQTDSLPTKITRSFICSTCDLRVPDECQHCYHCERCVKEFDHHCDYINNCIGAQNYSVFFRLSVLFGLQCLS
jgi:hypothetical protein